MISQLEILRLFKNRDLYNKYSKFLHERNFPNKDGYILFQDFGAYFESFNRSEINLEEFSEWYFHFRRPDLSQESREKYKQAIESLKLPPSIEFSAEALKKFKKQALEDKISKLAQEGADLQEIKKEISDYEKDDLDLIINTKVDGDIDHIISVTDNSGGFSWPLRCLSDNLPSLSKGIFVVVAARPGVGKSSFISHTTAHIINQTDGIVLWLNNENIGERACYLRLYEALFNMRSDELIEHKEDIKKALKKHKILDKVICHDIQGMGKKEVEVLISHYKPSLLIIDMLDYLSGFDIKNNETSDVKYLKLYQWALDLSCQYCPVIGTSQLADRAEGWTKEGYNPELSMWPLEADLMGSRTAKQGKASAIIMIGKHNSFPNLRYLSAPRNKYGIDGGLKHTITLDRERSRFLEK